MEEQHVVLTDTDTFSECEFAFPEHNAFAKITIHELTEKSSSSE